MLFNLLSWMPASLSNVGSRRSVKLGRHLQRHSADFMLKRQGKVGFAIESRVNLKVLVKESDRLNLIYPKPSRFLPLMAPSRDMGCYRSSMTLGRAFL